MCLFVCFVALSAEDRAGLVNALKVLSFLLVFVLLQICYDAFVLGQNKSIFKGGVCLSLFLGLCFSNSICLLINLL